MEKQTLPEQHHKRCLEALSAVDRALQEAEIPFYLIEGSALGAVRHQGFIPWDDDIDLGVLRKDARRAAEAVAAALGQTGAAGETAAAFRYEDRFNTPDFPRFFGKIIDNESGRGCIDIFPLIAAAKRPAGRKLQWARRKVLFKLYKAKIGYANDREQRGGLNRVKLKAARLLSGLFSKEFILRRVEKNETRYERKTGRDGYYINLYGAYSAERETIPAAFLETPSELLFEGKKYRSMGDPDAYLKNLYGDYMTPPPEEERGVRHDEAF